MPKDSAEML